MLIGRHLAVALVIYLTLLLLSSSAGQNQRCKRTLAVALVFQASAAVSGPHTRPTFAALAIALGLLPHAAAKPTSASPCPGPRAPLSLTHSHTQAPLNPPLRPPPPCSTPAALPCAGPLPPRGTPPSFLLLPPSLVIVIRE